MVEFVLVGNRIKLTALHLTEGWQVFVTRADVTHAVAFPFSSAVISSKLGSRKGTLRLGHETAGKKNSFKRTTYFRSQWHNKVTQNP